MGLEPTTSAVTGRRSNQLSYNAKVWWARLGLNQRPPACEADALPLSYAPFREPTVPGAHAVYRVGSGPSLRVSESVRGLLVAFALLYLLATASAGPYAAEPAADSFVRAHRAVPTHSPRAQAAFDDGLTLLYAFNPEQARGSFETAAAADPSLAMAWWGVAMSYGMNINTAYDAAQARNGHAAIAKARALESGAVPAERTLIAAATQRFSYDRPSDGDRSAQAYRDAMAQAATALPDDDDVQTLAAEAEMDVHPWSYFNADGTPTHGTQELIARLERVLTRNPGHIGANHFLIHALEESPRPQEALGAANRLRDDSFEPAAEHLAHMPAHAFMRVGDYEAAGAANARALDLYRVYLAGDPAGHADYFDHDCAFGVDAFMISGDYERARAIAAGCARGGSVGMLPIVQLRFRRWEALAVDGASTDLSAGMLAAHGGRLDQARKHLANLRKSDGDAAGIQADLIEARIAQAAGDHEGEIASLLRAVELEDRSGYSEPPAFWYPVRETLGAAYFRAGRYAEAERTFRADLVRNPKNPRSLFGLAQTLVREGRFDDARDVRARFIAAWKTPELPDINEM